MVLSPSTISQVAGPSNATPLCFSINSPPFRHNLTIASAYFSSVFSGLGLSSNLFALVVLARTFHHTKSRSRSSFLLFLGGLVFTDFMGLLVTGSIVVSFHITHFNWRQLDPHCHFCNFMGMSMVFYGLCPLLLGATMAVERFVGINRPFARSTSMSNSRACSTVVMVWITAGCISLLPLMGLGSYQLQYPGSWCFLNISSSPLDMTFGLIFSLVGLLSLAVSFLLNTVSVITLLRVCCGQDSGQRRRDYEVEMMVQLILIMAIASVCWCPLLMFILKSVVSSLAVEPYSVLFYLRLATCNQICDPWIYILCQESRLRRVFIAQTVLSDKTFEISHLLLWLRFATGNQVLDPWVYILFRRAILKRLAPRMDWSRGSIISNYPTLSTSFRKLTRGSLGGTIDRLDHVRASPAKAREEDTPLPAQDATVTSSPI